MIPSITVKQVLQRKGHGYWGVPPAATAYEALEIMAEKDIGALLVIQDGKLAGIFSERDYARKVILKGKSSKTTTVSDLMTGRPVTVNPEATMKECMALMKSRHIRHLPVMDGGALVGMITMRDVVDSVISAQEEEIEELENYITSDEYRGTAA